MSHLKTLCVLSNNRTFCDEHKLIMHTIEYPADSQEHRPFDDLMGERSLFNSKQEVEYEKNRCPKIIHMNTISYNRVIPSMMNLSYT